MPRSLRSVLMPALLMGFVTPAAPSAFHHGRVLSMPSETDLYFPPEDAIYEAQFIPDVELVPIPSIWGHDAGLGINPDDVAFLNAEIGRFLRSR